MAGDASQPQYPHAIAPPSRSSRRAQRHARRRRWWWGAAAAVVVAGGGTAAGLVLSRHDSSSSSASTTTAPSATSVANGPPCPLTGVPAPGGNVPQRPAVAVKVGNDPASRPWSGLGNADVVFEEPVEGGITRLVAVFQCKSASLVGPVRSARAVDAQIVDELSHPMLVHVGGIDPVLSLVNSANDTNIDLGYYGSVVQNPPGKVAPYATYFSTNDVWHLKPADTTPPAPLFTYSTTAPAGTPLTSIDIPFSDAATVRWNWDGHHWLLSYGGVPATSDGNQIAAANVVIQTVHISYGPWAENDAGGLEVQSRLTGSGQLLVLRNGEEIAGTWQRSSLSSITSLVATDGTIIPLAPGPTWVELVPSTVSPSGH